MAEEKAKSLHSTKHETINGQEAHDNGLSTQPNAMPLESRDLWGHAFGVIGEERTFDYIICGGGTAGLVLASRLSENRGVQVAVIEAGGFYEIDNGVYSQIPGYCQKNAVTILNEGKIIDPQPLIDWSQIIEPQKHLNGRSFRYAAGKTLGGGSARNFMTYHRATQGAYEKWADEVGDSSYTFQKLLPYFKKSVKFPASASLLQHKHYDGPAYSSTGGPISLAFPRHSLNLTPSISAACEKAGVKELCGLNSGRLIGHGHLTLAVDPRTGLRCSSESSFLQAALGRENLTVYIKTNADQVLFEGKRATGVKVRAEGVQYVLRARKEVIVSSGAMRSPHLLQLSGIGARDSLEKLGINVVADRPGIGQNLSDHMVVETVYPVNCTTLSALRDPDALEAATRQFVNTREGALNSIGLDILAFEKLPGHIRAAIPKQALDDLASFPADWPELEYLPVSFAFSPTPEPLKRNFMAFLFANSAPLSRGSVSLRSSNPADPPVVDPNYFSHPTDRQLMLAAFKRVREIAAHISAIDGPEFSPGAAVPSNDDARIMEFLREAGAPFLHATGTCKMGKADDPMAVVDARCRVIGVEGLRVVDISAFPFCLPGHPMSAVYALAEKIAVDILDGHESPDGR